MEIERIGNEEELLIILKGRLDTVTAPLLEAEMKKGTEKMKKLIFDFSVLDYLSSAGLRVLLAAQKMMNKQGEMSIKNVNETIMEVFEITGFSDILTIDTEETKADNKEDEKKRELGEVIEKAGYKGEPGMITEEKKEESEEKEKERGEAEQKEKEGKAKKRERWNIQQEVRKGKKEKEKKEREKKEQEALGQRRNEESGQSGKEKTEKTETRRMPVLEEAVGKIKKMEDTVVLHINHCMDNSFYFNDMLKRVYKEVIFVAVPYNNRDVSDHLDYPCYHARKEEDIYVLRRNHEDIVEKKVDFAQAVRDMIRLAFENELLIHAEKGDKIIIMEDGGYHYKIINKIIEKNSFFKNAVLGAVEQTTGGTVKSMRGERSYPVLSVARSYYKIRVEAYFIGKRVIDELRKMLHANGEFMEFHRILLIGYGIIGRMIALQLRAQDVQVLVYDTDAQVRRAAAAEGFTVYSAVKGIDFTEIQLVVGATGDASFTVEMLNLFLEGRGKRLYLASASSKQVEFMDIFEDLRMLFAEPVPYGDKYEFPEKKELILLANGSPVNFCDKDTEGLTFSVIDPVFAEMLFLSTYLYSHGDEMENKTVLLGSQGAMDEAAAESTIISVWKRINGIEHDLEEWNLHPCEEKLKNMIFSREEAPEYEL